MAISRQREKFQQRVDRIQEELPFYCIEYIDSRDYLSPVTLYNYARDFQEFFDWLIAERIVTGPLKEVKLSELENLPLKEVESYFRTIGKKEYSSSNKKNAEKRRISQATVNRKKSALRSLFNFLTNETENDQGESYMIRNVLSKVRIHKVTETLNERAKNIVNKIFVETNDINFLNYVRDEHILSLSPKQKTYFERDKERDFAILSLFLGAGIRLDELANLRMKDLDFSDGEIHVIRKGNKKDSVFVVPESMQDIKRYLGVRNQKYGGSTDEDEFVFLSVYKKQSSPLSHRAIQNIVYKYTKAFDKKLSPHKLRHTYATNLAEATGDLSLVMNQLGHTSTQTSLLYITKTRDKAKKASELLGKRRTNSDEK
ncbi:tyrosine recombinase XerS [Fictibacillus sp. BK138]|uniref:tyrosine recombinase XerS n=1 Tax=Fictibacillus sp. BK138 TaxID=2512121 RepID=UPI001029492E|nr:tyrosine recombinase XerS [Fictibacillus sp. BK138]RZT15484.1 site-specific recombinase XerC [Fictibacillus sp. BK138]